MGRLQAIAEGISRVGAIIGGAMLLIASLVICVDITLRYTISKTLGGADELSGYALAISSAWGFSAALLSRSHIRIDTLYVRVRTRVRAALDLLSLVTFASFIALITWHAWGVVRQSWDSGSRSLSELETPVIIPQALWFAGLVFFVMVALLLLARSLHAVLTGDLPKLFELIGSKSAVAEAEEEVRATERAMNEGRRQQ
ncbi:MAG: TRAP transporter small permease [Alphaproteobacteria bacterium]|jgi:TRAP-type C4-dicarboxylate transport system permease small subunit|nr:MAG: TRAP transporter small permease [Alphaproteobacteria bacterium]